jgi:hypothetical protein
MVLDGDNSYNIFNTSYIFPSLLFSVNVFFALSNAATVGHHELQNIHYLINED